MAKCHFAEAIFLSKKANSFESAFSLLFFLEVFVR